MLQNEVSEIVKWVEVQMIDMSCCESTLSGSIIDRFRRIPFSWESAAFSEVPDHTIRRYFDHHLKGILELLDTLCRFETDEKRNCQSFVELLTKELLMLINHMQWYYPRYFDSDMEAPKAYHKQIIKKLGKQLYGIESWFQSSANKWGLPQVVINYLNKMQVFDENYKLSFHQLAYFEHFVKHLCAVKIDENDTPQQVLVDELIELNFNDYPFFKYFQEEQRKSISGLSTIEQLEAVRLKYTTIVPERNDHQVIYKKKVPSIGVMIKSWLLEEAIIFEKKLSLEKTDQVNTEFDKVELNLSVAHLACLTKVFVKSGNSEDQNLTQLFKFITRHFRTKRQDDISEGSFSKEYYSITQKTAANVLELLLQMVAYIKKNFFPAMVTIGIIAHAL